MELLSSMKPTLIRAAAAAPDLWSWTGFPAKRPKLEVENNELYGFVEVAISKEKEVTLNSKAFKWGLQMGVVCSIQNHNHFACNSNHNC